MPKLDGKQVEAIIVSVVKNQCGDTIDLRGNALSNDQVKRLAKGLEGNTVAETLYLGDTELNDTGAAHLADALKENKKLVRLNLHNNKITDTGAMALSGALRFNETLENLGLYNNNIGDEALIRFTMDLKETQALKVFNIGENKITDKGAAVMGLGLSNTGLHTLYIYDNQISAYLEKEITDAITIRRLQAQASMEPLKQLNTPELKTAETEADKKVAKFMYVVAIFFLVYNFTLDTSPETYRGLTNEWQAFIEASGLTFAPMATTMHVLCQEATRPKIASMAALVVGQLAVSMWAREGGQLNLACWYAFLGGVGMGLLRYVAHWVSKNVPTKEKNEKKDK